VRRLVLLLALFLAGCGSSDKNARDTGPPPPPLAKRCGPVHVEWRTLWFTASDGTRLDGAESGSGGRGVVMVHESPSDLCGWEPYGATLAKRGFHVLLIDLRAFGLSKRGLRYGTPGAIADVRGAVDELKELGAEKVALVGASYGGAAVLAAAPALGSQISGVASLSGELNLGNARLNAIAAVPHLRAPLLIMGSRKDHYLDEADAQKLIRAAGSPQKSLVEFDGYDHGWNLLAFSHKQRAYQVLIGFLRRVTE
jgi:alpha-beta hydrolase superfamily lysophospholipase